MKILITGKNSYIGKSFITYLSNEFPDEYDVDELNVRGEEWKEIDFSPYDVLIHLAAIVHHKADDPMLYQKVNVELACDIAGKAKKDSVSHFIFFSTMGVYGLNHGRVDQYSVVNPTTQYAKSKYEAEKRLSLLQSERFKLAILRPPFVYGENAVGNYEMLSKLAKSVPFFPNISNQRSMIFIDNLSEFVRLVIENKRDGLLFPQNNDYVNTAVMVKEIAKANHKKVTLLSSLNPLVKLVFKLGKVQKVFGSYTYDQTMPGGPKEHSDKFMGNYEVVSFKESIQRSENRS